MRKGPEAANTAPSSFSPPPPHRWADSVERPGARYSATEFSGEKSAMAPEREEFERYLFSVPQGAKLGQDAQQLTMASTQLADSAVGKDLWATYLQGKTAMKTETGPSHEPTVECEQCRAAQRLAGADNLMAVASTRCGTILFSVDQI